MDGWREGGKCARRLVGLRMRAVDLSFAEGGVRFGGYFGDF
jgi:hypothetical protein